MWTKDHRERQKRFERQRYPTDLSDAEWAGIEPLLPPPSRRGRKIAVDTREILNALRYLARSDCGWRLLPIDFPPWQTVYWWFRKLLRRFLSRTIHDIMEMIDRELQGREASPSAGVLDSQTVKAPNAPGGGGYDAGKKTKGRKRHIAVDTDGHLLMLNLTTADVQDAAGAELIVKAIRKRWPWLKHFFADGACARGKLASLAAYQDFTLEVVRRMADQKGFQVLPRRWVVERTLGWMMRWRRLVRDYERCCDASGGMTYLAMGALMLRRIAHP